MRHTILAGTTALVLLMGSGVGIAQAQSSFPDKDTVIKNCIWNQGSWYEYRTSWWSNNEVIADGIRDRIKGKVLFWLQDHVGYSQTGLQTLIKLRNSTPYATGTIPIGDMYYELTHNMEGFKDCQYSDSDQLPQYTDIQGFNNLTETHQVFLQKTLQEELNYTRNQNEMNETIFSMTPMGSVYDGVDGTRQIVQKVSRDGFVTTAVFYDGAILLLDVIKIGKLRKVLDKAGKVLEKIEKKAEETIKKFKLDRLPTEFILSKLFCSFAPNTPVLMANGSYRAISSLKSGEMVASRNEFSGTYSPRKIDYAYSSMHQDKVTLELVNSQGEHETLVTTTEHPFFVKALGFTPAGNLKAGMVLSHHTPEKGNNLHAAAVSVDTPNELHIQKVTVQKKGANHRAWNLQIAKDHTFFVGKLKSWVHNKCASFADFIDPINGITKKFPKLKAPRKATVAIARTTIPGLDKEVIWGLSPEPRRDAGLDKKYNDPAINKFIKAFPHNEFKIDVAHLSGDGPHAEAWILGKISNFIEKNNLSTIDLAGKMISILVANKDGVCPKCFSKLPPIRRLNKSKLTKGTGIFRKFSRHYPALIIKLQAVDEKLLNPTKKDLFNYTRIENKKTLFLLGGHAIGMRLKAQFRKKK